ncbi:MAG: hypothetical protein ACJA2F_000510 [Nitriliruptoraceae bacterium]|jgi:hypothetical protein
MSALRITAVWRRGVAVVALAAIGTLGAASAADALTIPTEPPIPLPTQLPQPEPEPEPRPSPQPSPTPAPTSESQTQPDLGGNDSAGGTPTGAETPLVHDSTVVAPVSTGSAADATMSPIGTTPVTPGSGAVEAPQVAPSATDGGANTEQTLLISTPDGLAGALGGVFGMGLLTVLFGVATGFQTITMTNRGALVARTLTGEIDMDRTRKLRNALGIMLLGVSGVIGVIGYLRISVETLVPVQVVYLASAGFGVVVFGIAGGSLLIAETLRSDESRVRELEAAITTLAQHVAGSVQDPPRVHGAKASETAATAADTGVAAATETPVAVAVVESLSPVDDDSTPRVVRRVVRRVVPRAQD